MKKLYVQTDTTLTTLKELNFNNELDLQILLEKYPELIPSDEIIGNPSFFLIQRELPVSTGYIDHLFIDQMMVPTIVETKVNNPEIRRKIIGQGYEYLTSLSFELSGKQIINYAKKYWKEKYNDEVLKRLDIKELNEKDIAKNLKKPRLRLIFAADFIPRELRKFVEFINNISRGIDVYALQIEQYLLEDKNIISVNAWGPTESIIHDKTMSFGILTREEFNNKINNSQNFSSDEKTAFTSRVEEIINISEENHLSVGWGTKSFRILFQYKSKYKKLLEFYINGDSWVEFIPMENRDEFINNIYDKLNDIFDLRKKHLDKTSQYKMGARDLYQLSPEEYLQLIQILKSISEKRS